MRKMDRQLIEATELALSSFMNCDFTPDSLIQMEKVIQLQFPKEQPAQFPTTYIAFAIYLGETIVRNIPEAKWDIPEDKRKLLDSALIIPVYGTSSTAKMMPFFRVMKFFKDRTDGLKVFYDMANLTALGMLPNMENSPADGKWSEWKENPGGMKFRIKKVDK